MRWLCYDPIVSDWDSPKFRLDFWGRLHTFPRARNSCCRSAPSPSDPPPKSIRPESSSRRPSLLLCPSGGQTWTCDRGVITQVCWKKWLIAAREQWRVSELVGFSKHRVARIIFGGFHDPFSKEAAPSTSLSLAWDSELLSKLRGTTSWQTDGLRFSFFPQVRN